MSNISSSIVEEVKNKVKFPEYFNKVVLPELSGYYSDYTVDFEARPVVKCPLHGEDTPSLRYYEETNTFYCFGCGAGGDVIEFHKLFVYAITGVEPKFDEAVKFLYNTFIQGSETQGFSNQDTKKEHSEQKLSSNIEIIRLGKYIKELEARLETKEFTSYDRVRIYKHIDNIHLLSSLNLINATDAINFLKNLEKTKGQAINNSTERQESR